MNQLKQDQNSLRNANQTNGKPTPDEIRAFHEFLYGDVSKHGWRVRMNARFGFHPPDFWYELVVNRLINNETRWVDIGGGKAVFPNNPRLSKELSQRCQFLMGVDPSEHVLQNPFVHKGLVGTTDTIPKDEPRFHLATMRMVAEHIEQPDSLIASLRSILVDDGRVVVLTPNERSPNAVLASIIPNSMHPWIVSKIFGRMPEDVFPTFFRMNSRKTLKTLFERAGFEEELFIRADDCSTTSRFKPTYFAELSTWKMLKQVGLPYPESNLIAVFRRR